MESLTRRFKRVIALDLETEIIEATSDPRRTKKKKVFSYAMSWRGKGGVLKSVALPWTRENKAKLQKLAEDKSILWVFHNAGFDVAVLRLRGVNIQEGCYTDTMLLSYIIEPGAEHSLREAARSAGIKQGKIAFHDFTKLSREMLVYNRRDAEVTLQLHEILDAKLLEDEEAYKLYVDVDLPYLEILMEMEAQGFTLDKEKLEEVEEFVRGKLLAAEAKIKELVPYVPGKEKIYKRGYNKRAGITTYNHCSLLTFNPNSTAHIEYALRRAGWKPNDKSKKTKSGKLALSKDVLSSLASTFELAQALLDFRLYKKMHGTYLMKWRLNLDDTNRIYASFNYAATLTGRLSSSGGTAGNLQNIPARHEIGQRMRELVVAPPGYSLVVGDLSNFEARVLAYYLHHLCGDSGLAEVFIRDGDLHQFNADTMGITRNEAKTMLYLYIYGGTASRLSISLNLPMKKAEEMMCKLETNFPALPMLRDMVITALKANGGIVHDRLGRRLVYKNINSKREYERAKAERQVVNSLMQGLNASVVRDLSNLSRPTLKGSGGFFIGQIHDEVLMLIPTKVAAKVAQKITKIWCDYKILAPVPIKTEFKVAENWSKAK